MRGGGALVWEPQELEDHEGAGLLGAPPLQVSAPLHRDVELVPPAAGQLLQSKDRVQVEATPSRDVTRATCVSWLCVEGGPSRAFSVYSWKVSATGSFSLNQ